MPATQAMLAIAAGAALGANLRWLLGLLLNAWLPAMPLGTLAANLIGAFLIGLALPAFATLPGVSPAWKLFIVTGFLGALTTFSAFSAEVFVQLQAGRLGWALTGILAHVAGSLGMTALGVAVFLLLRR